MKKKSLLLAALALLSMATISCQKDESESKYELIGLSEEFNDNNGSKTFLSGTNIYWKKGDNVMVYLANTPTHKEYKNDLVDNGYANSVHLNPVVADDGVDATQALYAFYPSFYTKAQTTGENETGNYVRVDATDNNSDPKFVISLPSQQVLDNDTKPLDNLHLTRFARAAKKGASGNSLYFYNLCGVLNLNIKGNVAIEKVTFEADEASNGEFEIRWGSDGKPYLTAVGNPTFENRTTTLMFHRPVDVENGTNIFMALPQPPQRENEDYPLYHNVKITITNANYKTHTISYNTLRIRRSIVTTINRTGNDGNHPDIDEEDYTITNGIFTVDQTAPGSPTRKVYFSPGNLQYRSTNWQFANEQYEVLHGSTYTPDTCGSEGHEWDLFGWSTAGSNYGRSDSGYSWTGWNNNGSVPGNPFEDYGGAIGNSNWYTLPSEGWKVLLLERNTDFTVGSTQNVRFAPVGIIDHCGPDSVWVNGKKVAAPHYINGLLIFPDDFNANDWPSGVPTLIDKIINSAPTTFPNIHGEQGCLTLTKEQFKKLEAKGVIFLPCAGYAGNGSSSVSYNGEYDCALYYHTSTVAYTTTGSTFIDWIGWHGASNVNWISNNSNFQLYSQNGQMNLYNMQSQDANRRCAIRLVRDQYVAPTTSGEGSSK